MYIKSVILSLLVVESLAGGSRISRWSGRSLLNAFSSLHGGCSQGPQQWNSEETMLNGDNWWENNWGRSGGSWPRRGWRECWENRGDVCALPDQDHVVCLPGSRRGSTVNKGWALDPKSQACQPGVHCLYACEPGYYWTQFNQGETSNYDFANAAQRGNCDGTWDYGTSTHGVYCKEDGTLDMPKEPLCKQGETFVYAENKLDTHVFICQTVFPGHEIFLIPTLVKPGETVMITTQPMSWWHGPTFEKPPHGDFYVSFAGADIMEACTWDGFSPSGAALLPYEIGSGVEDNGAVYSTHYFYQQPNSEVPSNMVGYVMDIECKSSDPGVCGERVAHNNVITMVTKKKPPSGSTKVKFIFKKPQMATGGDYQYNNPNSNSLRDPMSITGLKMNANGGQSTAIEHALPPPPVKQEIQPPPVNDNPAPPPPQSTTVYSGDTNVYAAFDNTGGWDSHQSSTSTASAGGDFGTNQQAWGGGTSDNPWGGSTSGNSGGSGTSGNSWDQWNYGRRLQAVSSNKAFIENGLNVPVVLCGKEGQKGMSISPGERVLLPEEGEYSIGMKKETSLDICGENEYPWVLSVGLDDGRRTYSFGKSSEDADGINIKCDFCDRQNPTGNFVSYEDSNSVGVVFEVQGAHTHRKGTAYDWGKLIAYFIQRKGSSS